MPLVEAYGKTLEFPEDMSHEDMANVIRKNEHLLNPDYKQPAPEAMDYAKGFAAGANKLVSGLGYLAEVAGAEETGKSIREFGDRGAAFWNQKMSPGGKAAAESQVFVDDPESITGLRLGDNAGRALLMGASQSLPSMFAAALPGAAITKGIQALASLGLAGGAGATIPLLAGTAAPVGTAANVVSRIPSAIGFGAAEGITAGAMNAAEFKSSIENMPEDELSKSPVYIALKATHGSDKARELIANQAASDIFGRTALSTGAIGAVTGGGALGQAYQKATIGAGDGILKSIAKGAGQEALQETPQSGGEKYIENLATRDYLNPDVDVSSEVLSSAASGGAIGAFTGGIFGGGSAINITSDAQSKADRINAERAKLGLDKIVKSETVDQAINAANESVSQKPVDKDDVLRVADPTLADIERLTGLKPSETLQTAQDELQRQSQVAQQNIATGSDIEIVLPDNKTLKARWDIVDADNVKASLKNGVSQPRDRTRAASDVQIQEIANQPDYRRLADSPVMDIGAPVISVDGQIVGGNGRFEALSRAYDQGTYKDYLDRLKQDAINKGIDPVILDTMKKPVLVRRISEPFDTRQLAIASNSGMSAAYSDLEQAKIDAERLKGINEIITADNGDIVMTGDNVRRVRDALGGYNAAEIASFVDNQGQLSQQGIKRIRNAMLAKAYGDSPVLGKIIESTDSDIKTILGSLTRVAGDVVKARATAPKESDITPNLLDAINIFSQLKQKGQSVTNYLSQQDAFTEKLDPVTENVLLFLDKNSRSQPKVTQYIRDAYTKQGAIDATSPDIFGQEPPKVKDIFAKPTIEEELEKHLKKNGYDFDVRPIDQRDINALDDTKKAQKDIAEKQAKIFNKKIVFVKAKGEFGINGVMVPAIKDTIFINIETPKPFHAVMAHELSHWMEQEHPSVYKDMLGSLKDVIVNEEGYRKKYGITEQDEGLIQKEIAADLMGDNFTDETFWNKVAAANPDKWKEIAKRIIQWLKNTILKAKSRGMGSEEWVTDAKKAQDIIANSVAQYTKQQDAVGKDIKFHKAFHGSPHDHDKFDKSKIGTGEGAQAYGYGHYFTDTKEVAEFYKEKLTTGENYVNGELLNTYVPEHYLAYILNQESGNIEETRSSLSDVANYGSSKSIKAVAKDALSLLDKGDRPVLEYKKVEGKLYEVELAPEQDEYLLWDKPLSEQSDKVKGFLETKFSLPSFDADFSTAGEFYKARAFMKGDKHVSDELHSLGIRGIKYLDGSSRAKGEGAYNYVIFDDKDIEIKAKFSKQEQENKDKEYLQAVENGDIEKAQKMVDAAARDKGYISGAEYRMMHQAPNREDYNLATIKEAGIVPDDYWTHPHYYQSDATERESFSKVNSAIDRQRRTGKKAGLSVYRAVPKDIRDTNIRNGDWVTPSKEYAKMEGEGIPGGYRIISAIPNIDNLWWDANSINELGYDDGKEYAYKNTKNNRKLIDAVTYDDDGNVIPLSKRFNSRSDDVRFSKQQIQETLTIGSIERPTRNSEGKLIHPTEEGIRNFWKWFGDSKVVDDQGRPLVVYHGTDDQFNEVDMYKGAQGVFWFTSDKQKIINGESGAQGTGKIMELYVKIDNPADYEKYDNLLIDQYESENLDGAILKDPDGSFDGFVIKENQIKSAIGNTGAFSEDNNDIRFSFAGELAETANKHQLSAAQQRLDAGEDADIVRQETGWFKGADGKWRYEIDDSEAFLKTNNDGSYVIDDIRKNGVRAHDKIPLFRVLGHDKLFAAYPDLADISVKFNYDMKGSRARFERISRSIELSPELNNYSEINNLKSVLLHEIQHGIQAIEGFATGMPTNRAEDIVAESKLKEQQIKSKIDLLYTKNRDKAISMIKNGDNTDFIDIAYKKWSDRLGVKSESNPFGVTKEDAVFYELSENDPVLSINIENYNKHYRIKSLDGYEFYRRLYGEAEARNVQTRMKMSEQERKLLSPESTQDVSNRDVIITYNSMDMENAPPPKNAKPFNPNEDIPETFARKIQRKFQDKFNRFNVVKEYLEREEGIKISENADVYGAEERYHAKVANQHEDFRNKVRNPLVEKIAKAGFKLEDVEQYLLNRHAQEANVQNRKLTGKDDSTAYGISDEDAEAYIAKAPKELVKLADEVQAITKATQQLRLDNGIENQERIDAMNAAYQYYIPVRGGAEEQAKQQGSGKGLSVKYKPKRRLGHELRNESVIENIFQDYERAVVEVEKNRVGKSLALMAAEIQMPELISINQPVKRKVLRNEKAYGVLVKGELQDVFQTEEAAKQNRQLLVATDKKLTLSDVTIAPITDQRLIYSASPMLADNEVLVYMDGHEVRLQINDELLAQAYKNMGMEPLGSILSVGRAINGWMSKVYTAYNPEFFAVNVLRDFTSGMINLTGEQGIGISAKAIANYPKAFSSLLKYATTGQSDRWIDAYRDNGGNTGAAYLSDLERLGEEVRKEYASYQGVIANLKEKDVANALRAAGRKVFNATIRYMENLNQAGENAFRLATFKAMVESGKSAKESGSMAKNVTVNFNRKGEVGAQMNALYLFFNASIQGTSAVSHALFKGKNKYQAWGLAGSMMTLGYIAASMLGGFDDEDEYDSISDFVKSRNLIISYGDGYVKIPVPYGHGFFYNAGRMYAEAQRKDEIGKLPYQLAALATEEFSPFNIAQSEDSSFDSRKVTYGLIPTAIRIPVEITNNYSTFTGRELYPEKAWYKSEPDNEKMFRGTKGTVYDVSAQYLASIGVEISPETLKYLSRTATGGAGAFVDSTVSAAMLKKQGAELDAREIPFVRKFYGEATIQDARARYNKAKEEAREAYEKYNALRQKNDLTSVKNYLKDNKELLALNDYANKLSDVIKYSRDQQDLIKLSKDLTVAEKRLKIKELEKREEYYYDLFLNRHKKAKGKQRQQH